MEKDFLQHVFISYSRKDKTVKDKIVKDFEVANIPVWFDTDRIKHDTPNFENDIRKALKESFGFVLVASPRSCESEWVLSEIQIAKDYGVPIYPVRAYDAPWSECLPMSMSRKNGIDCQGANYGTGIIELVQALKEKRDEKLPYLIEVSENTRMPRCYLSITTTSHK